jgi:hypothetical protein
MKYSIYILGSMLLGIGMVSCKKIGSDTGIIVNAAAPTIATVSATNITTSGATVGGNITGDGGSIVMEAGVVYGTSSNPTTASRKKTVYQISGPFSINLSDLVSDSTYHYRAYAINSKGTTYGEDKSFTVPFAFPNGRVSYFNFNGSDSNVVNNTVGTSTNITWVAGVNGQAAQFNGTTSYITYPSVNGFENSTAFSIGFWFNSTTPVTGPFFSLNKNGFSWESTKLIFESEGSSTATLMQAKLNALDVSWSEFTGSNGFANVFDGNWHQIFLTYDGTKVTSYLDGQVHSNVTTAMPLPFGDFDSFTIGAGGWFGTTTISAVKIDQVGLYNTALTASQVLALYNHKL